MHDYTVELALFDYVPIVLTALALVQISRFAGRNAAICGLGAALIVSGGLLKATWKLIVASYGSHIPWMNNSLFILLAPGFVLVAWALLTRQRDNSGHTLPVGGVLAVLAAAAGLYAAAPTERDWFFWLLGVATLGNMTMIALLTAAAWRVREHSAAVFFVLSFVGTLTLSSLARVPEQTAALQWIEEGINTVAQAVLLIGALRLRRITRQSISGATP